MVSDEAPNYYHATKHVRIKRSLRSHFRKKQKMHNNEEGQMKETIKWKLKNWVKNATLDIQLQFQKHDS